MVPPVDPKVAEEVEVASRRGSSKDPELFAAQKIIVALEELDAEQQCRVLHYIQSRIQSDLAKLQVRDFEKHLAAHGSNEKIYSPQLHDVTRIPDRLRGAEAVVDRQPLAAIAPSSF